MFERILVPLDGSATAEAVLPLLGRILGREDSEILLLRVIEGPAAAPWYGPVQMIDRERERADAQKYVIDLAQRFSGSGAKVHGRIVEGAAADVILEAAKTEGATLIAMTTHGRSGLARWALGSVAEKVARASDVPLLLVRSFYRKAPRQPQPIEAEATPFKRILVPVDGSPASNSVVASAQKFAQLYGSEVLVLHVETPYVPPSPVLPGMEVTLPQNAPPATFSDEDETTRTAADRFQKAGLRATRLTTVGDPASEILDLSANRGIDLIAMATHGRTGLSRWAYGSVAERVLRSGEVPILLVREPAPVKKTRKPAKTQGSTRG